jgi:hypothetical protein
MNQAPRDPRPDSENHTLQDLTSKHDDRWNHLAEKRAGMAKWDKFGHAMAGEEAPEGGRMTFRPPKIAINLTAPYSPVG